MCTHKSFSTTVFVAVVSRDASGIFAADYIFKPQHQTLMLELTCEDERSCSRAALLRIGRAAPHSPRVCPRRAESRLPEEERTRRRGRAPELCCSRRPGLRASERTTEAELLAWTGGERGGGHGAAVSLLFLRPSPVLSHIREEPEFRSEAQISRVAEPRTATSRGGKLSAFTPKPTHETISKTHTRSQI